MAAVVEETHRFAGRFTEWTPLARGSEGHLYRVRDRWADRVVALKMAAGVEARRGLAAEYLLLGGLSHPCLIESLDLVRDGEDVGHLLEYVPAVAAESLWEAGGEPAVWAALTQSLRGLSHLHRRGYVHGDVAPGNLLVWREGTQWRAKVADFGLTLPAEEAARAGLRGTPGFMAPEVARGEGAGPAADLFALAVTAVTWIDGHHPLEGLTPAETLRRLAEGAFHPAPRRVVSRELAEVIAALGAADSGSRALPRWDELRERIDAWGPAVVRAGVHGVGPGLKSLDAWTRDLSPGRTGAVLVRGRVGSGRKTLCRAMARSLVAAGWTALPAAPLEAVRDRLDAAGGDPDPVTLARELALRFAGRDAVVLWPEHPEDLESRLLRAFVVSREEEGARTRTCVLRVGAVNDEDPDHGALTATARPLVVPWPGPDLAALVAIRDDLFPAEEGFGDARGRPEVEAGASPLSLVRLKQVGTDFAGELSDEAMSAEVARIWSKASPATRHVWTLLAWSEGGWNWPSIVRFLGLPEASAATARRELDAAGLTRRDFAGGDLEERVADRLVRTALVDLARDQLSGETLAALARELETEPGIHPGDLSLAMELVHRGLVPIHYLDSGLNSAVGAGRFESVIRFWKTTSERGELDPAHHRFLWDAALRAVRRLGRFPDEVKLLEELLLAHPGAEEVVEWRKLLAAARFAVGDWQGAVRECETLIAMDGPTEEDRQWARLQKAEFLWQTGRFEEADGVYEAVDAGGLASDELLLRLLVGRARLAGQEKNVPLMQQYLEAAIAALGVEFCEAEPLFLHARAGVMQQTGEQIQGEAISIRAGRLAEQTRRWKDFVMIASRGGALALESGQVRKAHRLGTSAVSVALALGSERMAGMAEISVAFYEATLGDLGTSLSRQRTLLAKGRALRDQVLVTQSRRLGMYLGCRAGLASLTAESVDSLSAADQCRQAGFIAECLGVLELGLERWQVARDKFALAVKCNEHAGVDDSRAFCLVMLALTESRLGNLEAGLDHFVKGMGFFEGGKYRFAQPIVALVGKELGCEQGNLGSCELAESLMSESRLTDLTMWGAELIHHAPLEGRMTVKKSVLSATMQVADSFESADLRRQFLSFPRTQRVLRAVTA